MELCNIYVPEEIVISIFSYLTLPTYGRVSKYLQSISRYLDAHTYRLVQAKYGHDWSSCLATDRDAALYIAYNERVFPFSSARLFTTSCIDTKNYQLLKYTWRKFNLSPFNDAIDGLWWDRLPSKCAEKKDLQGFEALCQVGVCSGITTDVTLLMHYDKDISNASMGIWKQWDLSHIMKVVSTGYPRLMGAVLSDCGRSSAFLCKSKFTFDKREPLILAMTLGSQEIVKMIELY